MCDTEVQAPSGGGSLNGMVSWSEFPPASSTVVTAVWIDSPKKSLRSISKQKEVAFAKMIGPIQSDRGI